MGEFVHALRCVSESHGADDVIVDGIAGIGGEATVEIDGIFLQLLCGAVGREGRAIAGGVPGRAGGQLVLFDEQAIAPAEKREMIERADPNDAPSDRRSARPVRRAGNRASREARDDRAR
jgi:hypothetical protein